jgi:hypothetical protein
MMKRFFEAANFSASASLFEAADFSASALLREIRAHTGFVTQQPVTLNLSRPKKTAGKISGRMLSISTSGVARQA